MLLSHLDDRGVSFLQMVLLLYRNVSKLIFSGKREARFGDTIFPAVEKVLSDEALVAGIPKYWCASFNKSGYFSL